jgi:hypothetical protein
MIRRTTFRQRRGEHGLMVEYVVILACAVLIAIAGLAFVGTQTSSAFGSVACGLDAATSCQTPTPCPQGSSQVVLTAVQTGVDQLSGDQPICVVSSGPGGGSSPTPGSTATPTPTGGRNPEPCTDCTVTPLPAGGGSPPVSVPSTGTIPAGTLPAHKAYQVCSSAPSECATFLLGSLPSWSSTSTWNWAWWNSSQNQPDANWGPADESALVESQAIPFPPGYASDPEDWALVVSTTSSIPNWGYRFQYMGGDCWTGGSADDYPGGFWSSGCSALYGGNDSQPDRAIDAVDPLDADNCGFDTLDPCLGESITTAWSPDACSDCEGAVFPVGAEPSLLLNSTNWDYLDPAATSSPYTYPCTTSGSGLCAVGGWVVPVADACPGSAGMGGPCPAPNWGTVQDINLTYTYYYVGATVPTPTISSINPTTVVAGDAFDIYGTGLAFANQICFGGPGDCQTAYPTNDTDLATVAPSNLSGLVAVTVVGPGGVSNSIDVSFASGPTITSVSVNGTAGVGAQAFVNGVDLDGISAVDLYSSGVKVASLTSVGNGSLSGTIGEYQAWPGNSENFEITLPALPAGTYDVVATTTGGTTATSSADQVTLGPPQVTNVQGWSTGMPGDVAEIGTSNALGYCDAGSGTGVSVGGTALIYDAKQSDFWAQATTPGEYYCDPTNPYSQLEISLPSLDPGTYDVTVTNGAGTSATSSADQVTIETGAAPSISSVTPNPAETGMSIQVQGTAMEDVVSGTISGEDAHCQGNQATITFCTVPADLATGSYSLVLHSLNFGDGSASLAVTAEGAPTISGVTLTDGGATTTTTEPVGETSVWTSAVQVSGTDLYNATSCDFVDTQSGADYPALYCSFSDGVLTAYFPGNYGQPTTLPPSTYDVVITTPIGVSVASPADQITLTP